MDDLNETFSRAFPVNELPTGHFIVLAPVSAMCFDLMGDGGLGSAPADGTRRGGRKVGKECSGDP